MTVTASSFGAEAESPQIQFDSSTRSIETIVTQVSTTARPWTTVASHIAATLIPAGMMLALLNHPGVPAVLRFRTGSAAVTTLTTPSAADLGISFSLGAFHGMTGRWFAAERQEIVVSQQSFARILAALGEPPEDIDELRRYL